MRLQRPVWIIYFEYILGRRTHERGALTWNLSVATFFSSIDALKSLSGCVLRKQAMNESQATV
jgi:hypothetical protein